MNFSVYLESIWRDVLYWLRTMARSPGFAVTATVILALGIGGNTAIFTVIRAVLLRPLEYRDPDRLVYLSVENPRHPLQNPSFSLVQFEEMKASAKSFASLGAYGRPENFALSSGGEPEELKGARVSANFLEVLGVPPALGRSFLPEEDQAGGRPVAMISARLWKRRFGGDPVAAGKSITLESTGYTIIGVLPEGFEFPYSDVDVWVTRPSEWSMLPPRFWGVPTLTGFGRLKKQVTVKQAGAEMSVLQHQYDVANPNPMNEGLSATMRVVPLKERLVANVRPMLWTMFGAVGFVLLIACANVASLLLARASSRSREFAVRAALGASRGQLIRQLLAESVVLAAIGGTLGVLLATWALSAIGRANALVLPGGVNALYVPGMRDIRLDGMVLAFSVVLSIATGVLFGLFPSMQISRPDLTDMLRDRGATPMRRGVSARSLLVTGQVALSIVLLIGATLLIKSFYRLHSVDPGFQSAGLLTAKIGLPLARYDTDQKREAFFRGLLPRLKEPAGVRNAAVAMLLPTTAWIRTNIMEVEGKPALNPGEDMSYAVVQSTTPDYLRTLGIPLKQGREFTERDDTVSSPPVTIVNETLARRLWPGYPGGVNPIGLHIKEGYDKALGWMEVIGIVADIHEGGLASDAVAEFYLPLAKHPPQNAFLLLRTEGDPMRFVNTIRERVRTVDQDQPISDVRTMEAVFEATLGQRRLTMMLLGSFACVALLLATVGIYGVIAYSVAQRTQEVGIRRALGAQQTDILRLILGQGLGLVLGGIAIGTGGALALTRVMKNLLFHVDSTDPVTFVGIALLFVVVALAASYIPARRAAKVDPMSALRVG
jgi:putative ABC transport system permease protein